MRPQTIPKTKTPTEKANLLFGESLVSKGLITRRGLIEALNEQREHGGRLGEVLIRLKKLSEDDITHALAEYLSMEYVRLDDLSKIDMKTARILPESVSKRFCLVPIGEKDNHVVVAMADPLNVIAIDTIALKMKRQIKVVISSPKEILHAIETIYHGSDVEEQQLRDIVEIEVGGQDDALETEGELESEAEATKPPVIRFVDLLLSQAVKSRASDVHIEPQERSMTIRMRIDGVLRDMVPPARKMQAAVLTRIKILSEMNIAERRLPQDGRFKMKTSGRDIDVRVSSIPTIYGEKIVLRILDTSSASHDIAELGFDPKLLEEFKTILTQPHGIIIVTGPTGSGKSTTLYSALNYLKDPTKNITTVEDPVEYRLAGINQIQIKHEIDLDFAKCLRAILRQDPDIILVGEIRDKETVEIAIKASLTGHLVLSTFHTNDAPSAISRLMYMGIEPFLLGSSLNLIIAQRLVRKICEHCKEPVTLSEEVLKRLNIDLSNHNNPVFYHGKGCNLCGDTGCMGRLPIFEFLVMDSDMRDKMVNRATESEVRALSRQKGYGGLLDSGVSKMLQGLTTAEEVLRVTFTEDTKT
ncbi:MAG: type II secretion system protein GspE [Phycisphaerae bacterium]|nr:type II secretion system protein GspE [Phycisphaerae bacterium]NIP55947.1 type II secretion system protein GspE [Phycisphaerae bacterium]NIS54513.1 type II secretion system protein GspE [Phycisphaerae bacterium]NIU12148.1 type II secretion system protein GspE [Phycisphaerae bacterium]NIU59993.1 type II secretion system protein GspE [Phycisphaerae bacterium]